MITVFTILVAAGFIYIGLKIKFFTMWAWLFNLIVAVYVSIMLTHTASRSVTEIGTNAYFLVACLIVFAGLVYAVLHILVKSYIIVDNAVDFPVLFDRIGASILAFVFGYIAFSFVLFALGLMPIAKHKVVTDIFGNDGLAGVPSVPIKKVCKLTGNITRQCYPQTGSQIIDWLMDLSKQQAVKEIRLGSARKGIKEVMEENVKQVEEDNNAIDANTDEPKKRSHKIDTIKDDTADTQQDKTTDEQSQSDPPPDFPDD